MIRMTDEKLKSLLMMLRSASFFQKFSFSSKRHASLRHIYTEVFIIENLNSNDSVIERCPGRTTRRRMYMAIFPMDADIFPPSDDRVFKVLLTHPNAKQVLIDIISTIIEQTVVDVHIRANEVPAMDADEKNQRFDVNCTIDTGVKGEGSGFDQVNVEMHSYRQDELGGGNTNFVNKYVYFLTDLHSSQESKGKDYRKLVKTYQITFCMYNVFPALPEYANWFSLRDSKGCQLTDQINMVVIELDKIKKLLEKPVEELTPFEKWSLFFRFAPDPAQRNQINDIIKSKKEIGMAAALLQEISKDENERARLRSRRMYEMDQVSNILTAEERGEIREREKWQGVVADYKTEIANKDVKIAGKDAEIARLKAELNAR